LAGRREIRSTTYMHMFRSRVSSAFSEARSGIDPVVTEGLHRRTHLAAHARTLR
jgi:hypothetical protein